MYKMIKRKCDNPKYEVVVCCQGNPFYYQHKTLFGALLDYCKQYRKYNKYNTMNFSLKRVL